ncbi:MAG: hypothetical protein R6X02_34965, partial [Enhygromyxa sp.]
MVQNTRAGVSTYALKSMADFRGSIIERHPNGMLLNINGRELWTNLIGSFNASNLLAVFAGGWLDSGRADVVVRKEALRECGYTAHADLGFRRTERGYEI